MTETVNGGVADISGVNGTYSYKKKSWISPLGPDTERTTRLARGYGSHGPTCIRSMGTTFLVFKISNTESVEFNVMTKQKTYHIW